MVAQLDGPKFAISKYATHGNLSVRPRFGSSATPTKEQASWPLQNVEGLGSVRVTELLKTARPSVRARFMELFDLTCNPFTGVSDPLDPIVVSRSSTCSPADCEVRVRNGVIRRVSAEEEAARPSLSEIVAFTVAEPAKTRRRAIDWPRAVNDALYARGFKSDLGNSLKHISTYLGSAHQHSGATGDIKSSFYQLELPEHARAFYRFRDSAGHLYECSRLMMGLVCAPDLQQIITSLLAGHPDYVEPEFAAPCPVDVWIDGVRYHGTAALAAKAIEGFRARSREFGVVLKESSDGAVRTYTWAGVDWDHERRSVRVADKTRAQLPERMPRHLRVDELHSLFGRLVYVAGVRQLPLVQYWWAFKLARRIFNKANKGQLRPSDKVDLGDAYAARAQFDAWLRDAHSWHEVRKVKEGVRHAWLFTDATLVGWGGVLLTADGQVHIVGGLFDKDDHGDICAKEAQAVANSVTALRELLLQVTSLDIIVDNTSVEHGMRRMLPRAEALAESVAAVWRDVINMRIALRIGRIDSAKNPADAISRGITVDPTQLLQATRSAIRAAAPTTRSGAVVVVSAAPD